ncbi:uncharacterized protein Bfra_000817 [Botrytis fragariae]|uniref:Uncharacterized protein n=1 Tax=Botrytis fragariae TaxID=1964551 RepID=A0A8H6B3S8_9HELO|nr:uncharacterized protein Bfra_000817 [Botrytis fragariae]KAF5878650.1 hypothetical protein Bfra_000817 [Botrytis fragariae]
MSSIRVHTAVLFTSAIMIFIKDSVTPFMRIGPRQIPDFLTSTKYRSSKLEKRSRFVMDLMPGQDKHNVADLPTLVCTSYIPHFHTNNRRYSDRAGNYY